jgi:hypothetical protein
MPRSVLQRALTGYVHTTVRRLLARCRRRTPAAAAARPSRRLHCERLEDRQLLSAGLHLHFGGPDAPVPAGYVGATVAGYTSQRGYGWADPPGLNSASWSSGNRLERSAVFGTDEKFYVDLPAGTYNVTAMLGDPNEPRGAVNIFANGVQVEGGLTTQAGQFIHPTFQVQVNNYGQLQLRFQQIAAPNTEGYFMLEALDITPVTSGGGGTALAHETLSAGWATFGQVLPQGAARGSLKLGDLTTQTDVKDRWADGSIKFAIITAYIPTAGVYDLTAGPAPSGSFTPTIPTAAVHFTIDGVTYTAALPRTVSNDLWLNGPLVTEWRWTVTPVTANGTPQPFLRVTFDTSAYADGSDRVEVTVANDLDQAGDTKVTYDVNVTANGRVLFQQSDVTQFYMTEWHKSFDIGHAEAQVLPDLQPAFQTGALPRYLSQVPTGTDTTQGVYSGDWPMAGQQLFGILEGGALDPNMTAHGGRPELGPYPDWAAEFLAHPTFSQEAFVLANGDLAGSWPVHLQEPGGGSYTGIGALRLPSIDERPGFWLDSGSSQEYPWIEKNGVWVPAPYRQRSSGANGPAGDPRLADRGYLYPDNAHQPSLAYIPYLLAGDRYYSDQMAAWANFGLLSTFQDGFYNARGGSQGLLASNEVRGIAWVLRNLSDAAAFLPDTDPVKAYLTQRVLNNLQWLNNYAATASKPLGVAWLGTRPGPGATASPGDQVGVALWAHNYVAWAIDHANALGFQGGDLERNQIAQFQLSLFTSTSYDWHYAGPYVLAIGDVTANGVRYYSSLEQVFDKTYPPGTPPEPFRGYFGEDARLSLMIGIENHWAGAQQAYDKLFAIIGQPASNGGLSSLAQDAGWAIAPPS